MATAIRYDVSAELFASHYAALREAGAVVSRRLLRFHIRISSAPW